MKLWPAIKKLLTYREPPSQEDFSLDGRVVPDDPNTQDRQQTAGQPPQKNQKARTGKESWFSNIIQPKKIEELASQSGHIQQIKGPGAPGQTGADSQGAAAGKDESGKKIVTWNTSGNKNQQASQKQPANEDQEQDTGSQDQTVQNQAGQASQATPVGQPAQAGQPDPRTSTEGGNPPSEKFSTDIEQNLTLIQKTFLYGTNADIIIRKFVIPLDPPVRAFIIFLEGMADKKVINRDVLEPLMRADTDQRPGQQRFYGGQRKTAAWKSGGRETPAKRSGGRYPDWSHRALH